MVTLTKYGAKYNRNILFLEGLSTDTKPTDEFDGLSIQNGSEYTEVDTGKKFLFDYDNATWYEVQTGGGGGGGGTDNYNDLSNRPSVNNTVLTGNKTSAQLGLASSEQGGKADTAIQGIKVNSSTIDPDANKVVNITVPTTAVDVSALPDTTKYAAALSLTINSSTFVMTGQLKDQNGNNLGTAQIIDLPLESVVVGGSYNSQTKKVVLTLQNGNTIEFSVADLVSGLQTELSASNKLNPAYINYDSTHRAVSDTEKSTWNSKQNAIDSSHKLSADLVDDTSTTNKFATAAELEQIQTNKNNISIEDITNKVSMESGFTIDTSYSKLYKQGKHIYGNLVLKKTTGVYNSTGDPVATITDYPPISTVITAIGLTNTVNQMQNIGWVYISSASESPAGSISIRDGVGSINNCAVIQIDYVTA